MNPWVATYQASRSFTVSPSLFKLRSTESMMPSNHLTLCSPLLLLPSIFVRVFSNESALYIRWPEYWSFIFSISPSNEDSGLISFRIDWFDLIFRNFCFPFTLVENKSCYMRERNLKAVILSVKCTELLLLHCNNTSYYRIHWNNNQSYLFT